VDASRALVAVAARSISAARPAVGLAQWRALVVLSSHEGGRVRELAAQLGVHPSSASRVVDRLVTAGLVSRTTSAQSRREVELRLTPAGRRLVVRVLARRRGEVEQILAHVPPAERAALAVAFERFSTAAVAAGIELGVAGVLG
jgi:DNA-binding MarR family transcriptional regulator